MKQISIFEALSGDALAKRLLTLQRPMHILLDSLLEESEILGVTPLLILIKIMQPQKLSFYIPGETLDTEKLRIRTLQFGAVPILFHIAETTKTKEISQLAVGHLCSCYTYGEIENCYRLVNNYIIRIRNEDPQLVIDSKGSIDKKKITWPNGK